jgi:hypothetical protein
MALLLQLLVPNSNTNQRTVTPLLLWTVLPSLLWEIISTWRSLLGLSWMLEKPQL